MPATGLEEGLGLGLEPGTTSRSLVALMSVLSLGRSAGPMGGWKNRLEDGRPVCVSLERRLGGRRDLSGVDPISLVLSGGPEGVGIPDGSSRVLPGGGDRPVPYKGREDPFHQSRMSAGVAGLLPVSPPPGLAALVMVVGCHGTWQGTGLGDVPSAIAV